MKPVCLLCLVLLSGCSTAPAGAFTSWREVPRHEVDGPPLPAIRWEDGLSLEELERAAEASPAVARALFQVNQEANRKRAAGELVASGTLEIFQPKAYRPYFTTIGGAIRQTLDIAGRRKARLEAGLAGRRGSIQEKAEVRRWTAAESKRIYWEAVAARDAVDATEIAATRSVIERVLGWAPAGWTLSDPLPSSWPRVQVDRALDFARSRPDLLAAAAGASEADALAGFADTSAANDVGVGVGNEVFEMDDDKIFSEGIPWHPYHITIEAILVIPGHKVGKFAPAEGERRRSKARLIQVEAVLRREVEEAVSDYNDAVTAFRDAPPGLVTAWLVPPGVPAKLRCALALARLEAVVSAPIAEFSDGVEE